MGVRFYAKPHLEILTLTEVKLADTDATNYLKFKYNEDASSDYYLYFKVNSGDRTIDLSGNLTLTGNLTCLQDATNGLQINGAGTNEVVIAHDGTDAYFKTDDGSFIFQTTEGTDTGTFVEIKPKGTHNSYLKLYDRDGINNLLIEQSNNWGGISAAGGDILALNYARTTDIKCWQGIASGNPSFHIYGWNTAGSDLESTELTMDDTNDEFLIQAANSANHEGITISLPEANQKFRIRDGSTESVGIYTGGIIDLTGQTITEVNASGSVDITDWTDAIVAEGAQTRDPKYALEIKVGGTSYYVPCFTVA